MRFRAMWLLSMGLSMCTLVLLWATAALMGPYLQSVGLADSSAWLWNAARASTPWLLVIAGTAGLMSVVPPPRMQRDRPQPAFESRRTEHMFIEQPAWRLAVFAVSLAVISWTTLLV